MTTERSIGLHLPEALEQTRRTIEGVLEYQAEHPELAIRYFNFLDADTETAGLPPWTGRVDGVVVGAGRSPGIAAWLRRGRVPVVNTAADLRKRARHLCGLPR